MYLGMVRSNKRNKDDSIQRESVKRKNKSS